MSYGAIAFNILAGLLYTPWMIRQIGRSDYGLFILSSSLIGMFLLDFGIGNAIGRYVSKYRAENNPQKINDFLGMVTKIYVAIDILLFAALFTFFFFLQDIYVELAPEEIAKFKVIYIITGLYLVISFPFIPRTWILMSFEKFFFAKFLTLLQKVLTVTCVVVVLLLGYKLYALVLVNALVGILIIIVSLFYIKKTIPIQINYWYWDWKIVREIFVFSLWITVIIITLKMIVAITPSILGVFSGTNQIGIFGIAMTIEGYTNTLATALSGLFLPKLSRMLLPQHENQHKDYKNNKEFESLMIRVGRIQYFTVGGIILFFVCLGKDFITLWLGHDFVQSYFVAVLLILPSLVSLTQDVGITALVVINKVKYRAFATIVIACISLVLSCLLTGKYGAIGSATGIFIGYVVGNIFIMNYIYYKTLGLNVFKLIKECQFAFLLPSSLFIIICCTIQKNYVTPFWSGFILKSIIFSIIYFLLFWFLGLNIYEKRLITAPIKNLFSIFIAK
jgi:Membrane protein involved in the export of O-antigen and teichoic acid